MIDARDYETHDELADAMQFEYDIAELKYLRKKRAISELSLEYHKQQTEQAIEEIKSKQLELQKNVKKYYKKLRLKRKREAE